MELNVRVIFNINKIQILIKKDKRYRKCSRTPIYVHVKNYNRIKGSDELNASRNKSFRLLRMNERLHKGEVLNKSDLAIEYGVSEKTIQRDIDELRVYFADTYSEEFKEGIKYDKIKNGYYLVCFDGDWFTSEEILALSKILLESRAFCMEELKLILRKLLSQATANDCKQVERIIRNEELYYVPLKHNKKILDIIWRISKYIAKNKIIKIAYTRKDGISKKHEVKPVAVMFSEYYFYLIAYMADDSKDYPTIFRIDRIEDIQDIEKKFDIPYKEKFNDGEFRKRVQFMFSGPLNRMTFEYSGQSIESVLDRLPTAEVISSNNGTYIVSVEVFGEGINMWVGSQGENIKIISSTK